MDEDPKLIQHTGKEEWNSWNWHWRETSHSYSGHINQTKKTHMFLLKKYKWLNLTHPNLFLPQKTKRPCPGFPKQRLAWAELQNHLLLSPSSSSTTHHVWPLTWAVPWPQRPLSQAATEWEPTNILPFSAFLPIFWYLHSVPSLSHSTYIILYCRAGKGFSIICNYFLIWPIWEVTAAEKNE